ncbi:TraR/DksA family transcriptional regulator [Ampullimonas aquatilis]|uniref:TraR/DksA family transcriptional regulator n=1 Tax=Ampullimonas aquatilis TaxID=1341549 RepID=UPI003C73C2A3
MTDLDMTTRNECRARLQQQRQALLKRIDTQLHADGEEGPAIFAMSNHMSDTDDWVKADQMVAADLAVLDHDSLTLRQVEAALSRLNQGDYGLCQDCGEAIKKERLLANPSAVRCTHCQTSFEKHHDLRPGATL